MMNPKQAVAVALAVAAVITSCSGSGASTTSVEETVATTVASSTIQTISSTAPTSISSTAPSSTSSTAPSSTTTAPAATEVPGTNETGPGPEPTTDAEWEAILEELGNRRLAIYAEPDLEAIAGVCAAGSSCEANMKAQIGDFIARGERTVGERPVDIAEIRDVTYDGEDLATSNLVFIDNVLPSTEDVEDFGEIVGPDGEVVFDLTPSSTSASLGTDIITRFPDDPELPWRLVDQRTIGDVDL